MLSFFKLMIMESPWCWWCCHSYPMENELHIPYKYDERRNKFQTTGHFCSWSCMKAYALDKHGVNQGGIICSNISLLKKRMMNAEGKKYTVTSTAPNRYALTKFGGTMSIDEFRQSTSAKVQVRLPNEMHVVHEVIQVPEKAPATGRCGVSPNVLLDRIDKSSTSTNEPLKLKRSKPTKKAAKATDSSLNFLIQSKPI